jgi:hypothetical protein
MRSAFQAWQVVAALAAMALAVSLIAWDAVPQAKGYP